MNRVILEPRENWQQRLEEAGCYFHTIGGRPYWNELAAYEFTAKEIDIIELAGQELHAMCLEHCHQVVKLGDYEGYGFPDEVKKLIERSWHYQDPYLYGRLDLGYDGRDIKLYEYNADTPTALPEASVWQWHALEDRNWPDQFNSIHEQLLKRFPEVCLERGTLHFSAMASDEHEDWGNLHYLMETALESRGIDKAVVLSVDKIGWQEPIKAFVDENGETITRLFKLYPWEWMMGDEFGWEVRKASTQFLEPPWKMLLSTKALLPLLWKRFPRHSLLLEAYFETGEINNWAPGKGQGGWIRKPMLGREGANITYFSPHNGNANWAPNPRIEQYDQHGYIVQRYFPSIADGSVNGTTPVLGVWLVGETACGLGIREEANDTGITTNASQFVPHYFKE